MARFPMPVSQAPAGGSAARSCGLLLGGLLSALLVAGCAGVDVQHRQPVYGSFPYDYSPPPNARRDIQPPDTVYTGSRVFQDRCAGCHGTDARGSYQAPNLLPVIRTMDSRRFITHVLYRYEWGIAAQRGGADEIDALISDVMERKRGEVRMPIYRGEPRVTAHIADLWDYLSARADGSVGPWRSVPYQ